MLITILVIICIMLILCYWATEGILASDIFVRVRDDFKFFIIFIIAVCALAFTATFIYLAVSK